MNTSMKDLAERLEETQNQLSHEVAKRQQAEEKLKQARETFKLALREMPVIIYATDEDGSVVFFNREFENLTGYGAEDLADNPEILQLLFQARKSDLAAERSDLAAETSDLATESEAESEWNFLSKDGIEKTVYWSHISEYPPMIGWKSWRVGVDITELKATRAKVKVLSGLLPICSHCKKIRDDKGYWNRIEAYIHDHSEAGFTHGICPSCAKSLYPELYSDDK